jgi:hypothetical protein
MNPPTYVPGTSPLLHYPGWLGELAGQWGEPRVVVEDQPMTRHGSPCHRDLWVWCPAPERHNRLLTVDRYAAPGHLGWRWEISAEAHEEPSAQVVMMTCRAPARPDSQIRRVLAAAGWLPARPPGTACLACSGTGNDDGPGGAA